MYDFFFNFKHFFHILRVDTFSYLIIVILFVDIKSNIEADCDCIACVISSHGAEVPIAKTTENTSYTRHHILFTKDGIIPTDEILELFNDEHCPRLRGKPRMFFIQVYFISENVQSNAVYCNVFAVYYYITEMCLICSPICYIYNA